MHYPSARLSLYAEVLLVKELTFDTDAIEVILQYMSGSHPRKLKTFCYVTGNVTDDLRLSTMSTKAPKIHLALQYVIKNFFRIPDVIAVRIWAKR